MMSELIDYDPHVPAALRSIQTWFGSIITQSMGEGDRIQKKAPNGLSIVEESKRYITPSPTLEPYQRMQIYNQQYWWRLLGILQTNFPLVTRLFGRYLFNQTIAVPFLVKYPPDHWFISNIGDRLLKWVEEEYVQKDSKLVFDAVKLDLCFATSFLASQHPLLDFHSLSQTDTEALLKTSFFLQPHLNIVRFDYDLLLFRESMLKEKEDHWVKHPFPHLDKEKPKCFAIFRNQRNRVAWREISAGEYLLLREFNKGLSIEAACEWIESQEEVLRAVMEENLQQWIQQWTQSGWLTLTPNQ